MSRMRFSARCLLVTAAVALSGLDNSATAFLSAPHPSTASAAGSGGPRLHFRAEAVGPYFVAPGGSIQLGGSATLLGDSVNEAKLREIGLALHNYASTFNEFPPAQWTDSSGTPLLSWRVLILPFLGDEEAALFKLFDLHKAWDDPVNLRLLDQMPEVYCNPHDRKPTVDTHYAGIAGPDQAFQGAVALRLHDFSDGTSNTAILGPKLMLS